MQVSFIDLLVEKKNYYLPAFSSKAITEDYLLGIARQQFFSIDKKKIEIKISNKATELYYIL